MLSTKDNWHSRPSTAEMALIETTGIIHPEIYIKVTNPYEYPIIHALDFVDGSQITQEIPPGGYVLYGPFPREGIVHPRYLDLDRVEVDQVDVIPPGDAGDFKGTL